jgi:Trypsin
MIIRHDRSDRDSLVDTSQWPGLTSFFRGTGGASLIAPGWLLTAAHVVEIIPSDIRLSVELAGQRYRLLRTILHPDYNHDWIEESEDNGGTTVDLALVELETPVENVLPFKLYEGSNELGQEVLLLGQGEFGNGKRGSRGSDRALRQATNRIDTVDAFWLKFRFDEPPEGTFLEGVCGRGDSGGPAFIQENDRLLLAGISSWQQIGDRTLGTYGCIEHYTRVSRFIDWIRSTCNTH